MASQPQYVYEPLPNSRSIRLLRLLSPQPNHPSTAVHCSLTVVSIDSPEAYEALSYVWGDPTASKAIFIDGYPAPVAANCFQAIRGLAPKSQDAPERLLWVDSVCINQKDIPERNAEVTMMAEIYGAAERVVVWLGEGAEETNEVIEKLHVLRRKYDGEEIDDETVARCKSIKASHPSAAPGG
jgi:hypothetical protein